MAILVNVKHKAAVVFHSLVEVHAAEIGTALAHRLRAFLKEGEKLPDVRLVLVLLARLVAHLAGWLVDSQQEHENELGANVEHRARRDTVAAILRRKLVNGRALVEALVGRQRVFEILGLEGPTAEVARPDQLCQQADKAARCLRGSQLEGPGTKTWWTFDAKTLAQELEPGAKALRQALDAVEQGQLRASRTLAARDDVLAELEGARNASALVMKGLSMLAGRSDLVRQIQHNQ